jgi:hypothetical protein
MTPALWASVRESSSNLVDDGTLNLIRGVEVRTDKERTPTATIRPVDANGPPVDILGVNFCHQAGRKRPVGLNNYVGHSSEGFCERIDIDNMAALKSCTDIHNWKTTTRTSGYATGCDVDIDVT